MLPTLEALAAGKRILELASQITQGRSENFAYLKDVQSLAQRVKVLATKSPLYTAGNVSNLGLAKEIAALQQKAQDTKVLEAGVLAWEFNLSYQHTQFQLPTPCHQICATTDRASLQTSRTCLTSCWTPTVDRVGQKSKDMLQG